MTSDHTSESTKSDITGTITNQASQPIGNTTVKAFAYTNATSPSAGIDQLAELSNPLPDAFAAQTNLNFQLLGDGGTLTDADRPYALLYEESKFASRAIYDGDVDLSDPKWRQIDQGETLAIAVGDPTATSFLQDEYDSQVPGNLIGNDQDVTVEIQEVLPSGENGSASMTKAVQRNQVDNGILDPTRQFYATLDTSTLTPGFYRITPTVDGDPGYSYIVRIGSPYELINRYTETAEGTASQLATQAREAITQDRMVVKTAVTNESGSFAIDVPDNTQAVQIQAYRTNADGVNLANLTLEDLSSIDGALYFPTRPKRVTPPASNVQLRLTEVSAAPGANVTKLQQRIERLKQRVEDSRQTFGNTVETVQDVAEKSFDELRAARDRLAGIVSENEQAEQYYCQNYPGCEGNTTAFEEIDNKTRLNQQITGLGEALEYAAQTVNASTIDESVDETTNEVFELIELPFAPDSLDDLTATATFEDGSTETIGEDALTVNNDTLVVSDWEVPDGQTLADVSVNFPGQDVTESPNPIDDRGQTISGTWSFEEDLSQFEEVVGLVKYEALAYDTIANTTSETVTVTPTTDTVTLTGTPVADDGEVTEILWKGNTGEDLVTLDSTRIGDQDTLEDTANLLDKSWDVGFDAPALSEFDVIAKFTDGTEARIPSDHLSTSGQTVSVSNWSAPQNKEFDGVRFDWPSDLNAGTDTEVDVPDTGVNPGLNRSYELPYNVSEEQVTPIVEYADGTNETIPRSAIDVVEAPDGSGTTIEIDEWPTVPSGNVSDVVIDAEDVAESSVNVSKQRFYSATIQFGDLLSGSDVAEQTDVSIIVRYQDGTVQQMNESYWSLNKRVGLPDQVVIENYPIPESKSVATVDLFANTEDGLSKIQNEVQIAENPLELESIAFSDRSPGPQSPVSVTVAPSGSAELVDVDVIGPDNAELNHTQTGRTATFTTAGAGIHDLEFTFQTETGMTTIERSIQAFEDPPIRSPAVRESGDVAIADGLANAEVSSSAGGRTLSLLAVLEEGQETPSKVRYYAEASDTAGTTYQLAMVQGETRQAVSGHQAVELHLPPLPEDTLLYRVTDEGSEPITANASIGSITRSANKTVVETYTTTDGDVGVEVVYDPGILEQVDWWVSTSVPDISLPSFGFGMASSPLLGGAFLVFTRRRKSR